MRKKVRYPRILFIAGILLASGLLLYAQNPIAAPGLYMADPTARVWDDGRLYIYGSVDEPGNFFCSYKYHVLSTDDLVNWTLHENSFSSRGEGDQVPYNDALLFAPDCVEKDGSYFLYYCQPDPRHAEGVAVSQSPVGPFIEASAIDLGGYNQIDPCLFLDEDGQAYYIWGQFTMKIAKMNPDMRNLDLGTLQDSVLTEGEHYFHEGAHMVKRQGIYYLVYAHLNEAGMPTGIGYSTSHSPMGPFAYGGVIVDNDHCDPGNWNNHGSIMEFKGQWYVFYHRATHNSQMMRKACMEPIFFNEDGSIDQVEMTSQGAGPPLKASSLIPAERACILHGNVRIQMCSTDNEELAEIWNQDKAAYKYVDFGAGVDSVYLRVKPGMSSGSVSFRADMPWGPRIASMEIQGSDGASEWLTLAAPAEQISGTRTLWLVFQGRGEDLYSVDWFKFE